MPLSAVIFYLVSLILIALGIAIWNGKTNLIHNYHRKNVTDMKGYGKAMGKAISAMGVCAFISASLSFLGEELLGLGIGIFIVGFISFMIVMCLVQKKYNGSIFS